MILKECDTTSFGKNQRKFYENHKVQVQGNSRNRVNMVIQEETLIKQTKLDVCDLMNSSDRKGGRYQSKRRADGCLFPEVQTERHMKGGNKNTFGFCSSL